MLHQKRQPVTLQHLYFFCFVAFTGAAMDDNRLQYNTMPFLHFVALKGDVMNETIASPMAYDFLL